MRTSQIVNPCPSHEQLVIPNHSVDWTNHLNFERSSSLSDCFGLHGGLKGFLN